MSLFFSSRCMLELKFVTYYRAASLPSQASYAVLAEESLTPVLHEWGCWQDYLWALDNIIIWIATFLGWNKVHSTQITFQFKGNHRIIEWHLDFHSDVMNSVVKVGGGLQELECPLSRLCPVQQPAVWSGARDRPAAGWHHPQSHLLPQPWQWPRNEITVRNPFLTAT